MVGMASQNENSAAERRSAPSSMAATIVAPERDTPGIMDRHCAKPNPKYNRQENVRGLIERGIKTQPINPQQDRTTHDEGETDDPNVEQHRFDNVVRERADHRRRQECNQHADDEAPSRRIAEHAGS